MGMHTLVCHNNLQHNIYAMLQLDCKKNCGQGMLRVTTNAIFELSLTLNNEGFSELLDRMGACSLPYSDEDKSYSDQSLADKGIVVRYRDSKYKKKVFFTVNTGALLDGREPGADKLVNKTRKYVRKYFGSEFDVDDFVLSDASFTSDIKVGNHNSVFNYLKVLHRIGKVKGFSPVSFDFLESTDCFCLSGNSNGIDFLLYDLEGLVTSQLESTDIGHNEFHNVKAQTDGIIRAEVRLTKPKMVRSYSDASCVPDQLMELWENRQQIFLDTFTRVIPLGNFYKKDKAIEIIQREVEDSVMRRKMLRLVELIPEKKSLWLAQKVMQCRDIDKLMRTFAKIELSPVTLSKRHDVKHLKSLYSYL